MVFCLGEWFLCITKVGRCCIFTQVRATFYCSILDAELLLYLDMQILITYDYSVCLLVCSASYLSR